MNAESLIDEIKAKLDIVDVISSYIELKRTGQNYKGLCPFHSEKTPSFTVSPDKQIFHCFGCSVGGNLVNFIMQHDNLSFPEALNLLAKKAGINLKGHKFDNAGSSIKTKLTTIHKEVSKLFTGNLKQSKKAHAYLLERGLTEETISMFSLGYALKEWHNVSNYLKDENIPAPVILQSGLVSSGDKGMYDTFRDRVIFPINDLQGDIIAFGGRVMDGSEPKYLNSPDTLIFKKGENLYGLNLARDGIRKMGYAIIAEGYFDVAMCHQYGFTNTVAPLGTALTAGHLNKLGRFTRKLTLVFDGDKAGKMAARRSIPVLFEQGFVPKILLLPENDDPDSFLRKNKAAALQGLMDKAISPIAFIVNILRKDRMEAVRDAIEVISSARDMILREELVRELAEKTGLRETVLREEIKRLGKKKETETKPATVREKIVYDEEFLLLSAAIAFPDKLEGILNIVPPDEFKNSTVRNLFRKMVLAKGRLDAMTTLLGDDEKMLFERLALNQGFDPENTDTCIEDCIKKIVIKRFDERLREAEVAGDLKLFNSLLLERHRMAREAK